MACSLASILIGCSSIPRGRAAINAVDVRGATEVDDGDIQEKIATRPSRKFLALFRGIVYDYELFNIYVLQRDLQRIERYYRARGFYKARVRAGQIFYVDQKHVRVVIEVEEGPPIKVTTLALRGLESLSQKDLKDVQKELDLVLKKGDRLEEDAFVQGENTVKKALTDRGYAFAQVKRIAEVDLPHDYATIAYDVALGDKAVYGPITIEGLGEIPESKVRSALLIDQGKPYSTRDTDDAQTALLDLGVFSSVKIEPVLNEEAKRTRVVPLKVSVEPTKLRALRVGGGIELDALKSDVHLLAGWEDRNFLGGLRHFDVEVKPGVVLYPTRINQLVAPTNFLPELRTRATLRQPGVFEGRTAAFIRGEFNRFPVLLSEVIPPAGVPVLGYNEIRGAIGLDRSWKRFYVSPSQNVQTNQPFTYIGVLDPDLGPVLVSYPELVTTLDLRNDKVKPRKGLYLSNDFQYAGLGGDARDIKVQPEARGYIPIIRTVTFGLRAKVGLLFAQNYGTSVKSNAEGNIPPPEVNRAGWVRDTQIGLLRGLFSGGPSSNRGYALRGVGPHGVIPFYAPSLAAQQIGQDCINGSLDTSQCKLPLGGFTLWEGSAELRFALSGPVDGVTFCDTSDVSPSQVNFRFDRPHLSCGPGLRVDTPVGPIRLDIGYRIPGMQTLGSSTGEGTPSTVFGLPIAVAVGVGETF